jgi:hypothetical protein
MDRGEVNLALGGASLFLLCHIVPFRVTDGHSSGRRPLQMLLFKD